MGAGARTPRPSDRRTWPRSTRRTIEGSISCGWEWGRGVCVCERVQGPRRNVLADGSVQGRGGKVFANVSAGADTKANTLEAAAHLRLVIFVSLRTAASAEAPSSPMLLPARLQARGAGWKQ
eukprot:scaffold79253_cov51-Phaeocystis_antarctica.AAC.3